jgi:predicted O-methyltransferase YrrM
LAYVVEITTTTLIDLERRYAPTVGQAPAVFSPYERIRTDTGNAGGDKMSPERNGYAQFYADILDGFRPLRVVELGVFQGVSLAVWSDLFPDAEVIGLDLDFDRFYGNLPFLRQAGAFSRSDPRLVVWDAYSEESPDLPRPIDLFVDDGPHTLPAIKNALSRFGPLMADGGVYVVEDFDGANELLRASFPDATVVSSGRVAAARM